MLPYPPLTAAMYGGTAVGNTGYRVRKVFAGPVPYPIIDTDECIGCGACVDVCATGAIEIDDGFCTVVDDSECKGCGECQEECPVNAITEICDDDD